MIGESQEQALVVQQRQFGQFECSGSRGVMVENMALEEAISTTVIQMVGLVAELLLNKLVN